MPATGTHSSGFYPLVTMDVPTPVTPPKNNSGLEDYMLSSPSVAADPAEFLDDRNTSSVIAPDPDMLVRPRNPRQRLYVVTVGSTVGIFVTWAKARRATHVRGGQVQRFKWWTGAYELYNFMYKRGSIRICKPEPHRMLPLPTFIRRRDRYFREKNGTSTHPFTDESPVRCPDLGNSPRPINVGSSPAVSSPVIVEPHFTILSSPTTPSKPTIKPVRKCIIPETPTPVSKIVRPLLLPGPDSPPRGPHKFARLPGAISEQPPLIRARNRVSRYLFAHADADPAYADDESAPTPARRPLAIELLGHCQAVV